MRTIDLTPTWGEVGNIIWRFATSNEQAALGHMHSEFARAFAMAEAFTKIYATLTEDQKDQASKVVCEELTKQGF
jgi:hypothetical protein